MNLLIAMNSFKGSLSAQEASNVVKRAALELEVKEANIRVVPIVDGGTGSLEVWGELLELEPISLETYDPLGNPIKSTVLIDEKNKSAYIEMAKASGIHLINPTPKTISKATTYGTGVLLRKVMQMGSRDIFLGIGGSATHDVGTGILRALGVKFYNNENEELFTPTDFFELDRVDFSALECLPKDLKIVFLCDVNNKLLGPTGSAYTYAPQKGAVNKELVDKCEELSQVFFTHFRDLGYEIGNQPGDGAAGGLPSIIRVLINSEMKTGVSFLNNLVDLDHIIKNVDLIITGEGKFDEQSFYGKGPGYIIDRARKYNKHVLVLSGLFSREVFHASKENTTSFISINNSLESIEEALENTETNLYQTSKNSLALFLAGFKNKKIS